MTLGVILLLAAGCAAMYYADLNKESVFPAAAATIAVGALFVTAYSAFNSSSRMRKKDSLEAWTEWSDSTRAARRRVTDVLGEKNLTMKQGKALLGDGTLVDKDGNDLTEEQCLAVDRDITDILNGLERLGAGAVLGVYSDAVFRIRGGTIIERTYQRFLPYIIATREAEDVEKRQTRAFTELSVLYQMIEPSLLSQLLRGSRASSDQARLDAYRRA
ncbi:hypothetical protein ACJH6J_21105 [Mycobacterium sp. SMC-18]|uniref:DUF4760 domain-containing protein n=1 Tax=unclassified Mycobacterium TaxID=2642494 RepID=UPI003204756C